jgi:peptidoglycan/LPS O-acetylase OafA/YrhL
MFAIAFPVTYGLAFLSWRLVERPALALKRVVAPGPKEPVGAGVVRLADR